MFVSSNSNSTASENNSTRVRVFRRAKSCCEKKLLLIWRQSETDFRRRLNGRTVGKLQQFGIGGMAKTGSKNNRWETLLIAVVVCYRVVKRLTGKCHPV